MTFWIEVLIHIDSRGRPLDLHKTRLFPGSQDSVRRSPCGPIKPKISRRVLELRL